MVGVGVFLVRKRRWTCLKRGGGGVWRTRAPASWKCVAGTALHRRCVGL